jgi:hypothetical protein
LPARTAQVSENWMVDTVDIKLAAHHAVIETSLLLRKIAQGDCRATPQGRQENRMLFGADTVPRLDATKLDKTTGAIPSTRTSGV